MYNVRVTKDVTYIIFADSYSEAARKAHERAVREGVLDK